MASDDGSDKAPTRPRTRQSFRCDRESRRGGIGPSNRSVAQVRPQEGHNRRADVEWLGTVKGDAQSLSSVWAIFTSFFNALTYMMTTLTHHRDPSVALTLQLIISACREVVTRRDLLISFSSSGQSALVSRPTGTHALSRTRARRARLPPVRVLRSEQGVQNRGRSVGKFCSSWQPSRA